MSDPLRIERLGFIPKGARQQLRRRGISFSTDLLRCATLALQNALGKPTTLSDVRRWQSVASLLEIDGMTLKWALALHERGVYAARDLGRRAFSQLNALFAAAKRQGAIATVPDADTTVALMLDSLHIRLGAVLNATVTNSKGKPLVNATLNCGTQVGMTDSHGRARLLRLPLGSAVELTIEKPGYLPLTATLTNLRGVQVIEGQHFALKRARTARRQASKVLSEFKGDRLPSGSAERIQSLEIKNRPLRPGDVLRYVERLQRGGDAKLASYFKDSEGGHTVVRIWRVPGSALPANCQLGDTLKVSPQGLVRTAIDSRQLARLRIARQVSAELRRLGKARTRAQARRRVEKGLKLFIQRTQALRGTSH